MANEPDYETDDLLQEFLSEAVNGLRAVDAGRAQFKRTPADPALQRPLLELLHTAKGACGFLPLPRLEALASASTALVDGVYDERIEPTPGVVLLIFGVLDRLRDLLDAVSESGREPKGDDSVLVGAINAVLTGALPPTALPRSILFPAKSETGEDAGPESAAETPETGQPGDRLDEAEPEPLPGKAFLLFRQDRTIRAVDAVHVEWLDVLDREPPKSEKGLGQIPFQGASLPLAGDDGAVARNPDGPWPMIVLSSAGNRIGLIVDEVMEVVADPFQPLPRTNADGKGGTLKAADVIDVSKYFD
jgi:chemotaxis protein histidine kinase CheA